MELPFYIPSEPRTVYIATGQSNMNRKVQAELLRLAANKSPRLSTIQTNYHGGAGLSLWMSGTDTFTRASLYRNDFYNFDGAGTGVDDGATSAAVEAGVAPFVGTDWTLCLLWFQGETDAEDPAKYFSYRERFEAMLQGLYEDYRPSRVRWVAALPYRDDGVNAAGLLEVRNQLTAAANNDPNGAVIPTNQYARVDGVHISETNGDSESLAQGLWANLPA